MEKRFVYADNAATTPLSEIAFNAMKPWLTEHYGNPSSLYRMGREAKEAINEARANFLVGYVRASPGISFFDWKRGFNRGFQSCKNPVSGDEADAVSRTRPRPAR